MMKNSLLSLLFSLLFFSHLKASIIETPNLDLFQKTVEKIDQQTIVLFDVNETLIVSKDLILRPCLRNILKNYLQEILENPEMGASEKYSNSKHFLWDILFNAESEVVDPKVLQIIQFLQQQNIKTIAFTNLNAGSIGNSPSRIDWAIDTLKKLHLDFGQAFPQLNETEIKFSNYHTQPALFKQGLLCTNQEEKGPVFIAFLNRIQWTPAKVIFIDNHLDNLQSVEESLKGTGIEFIGFHYTAVENFDCISNETLAKFQLSHFVKSGIWLTDSKALELMKTHSYSE